MATQGGAKAQDMHKEETNIPQTIKSVVWGMFVSSEIMEYAEILPIRHDTTIETVFKSVQFGSQIGKTKTGSKDSCLQSPVFSYRQASMDGCEQFFCLCGMCKPD